MSKPTDTLSLVAVEGRSFPREDFRTRFVDGTDTEPTIVKTSTYYRRGLSRGDVREPCAAPPKTQPKGS